MWPHVYIPLLPISLADYTESPVPFIMGIDKSSPGIFKEFSDDVGWQNLSPSEEVIIVDIESNVVFGRKYLEQMPVRHKQALHSIIKKFSITCIYPELPQDPITPDPIEDTDSGEELVQEKLILIDGEHKSSNPRPSEKNIQMVYSEEIGWHLVEEGSDSSEKDDEDSQIETPSDSVTALRIGFLNVWISLLKVLVS